MKTIILLLFPYLVFSQTAPKLLGQTTLSKLSEAHRSIGTNGQS